jgi:hypothetical protein
MPEDGNKKEQIITRLNKARKCPQFMRSALGDRNRLETLASQYTVSKSVLRISGSSHKSKCLYLRTKGVYASCQSSYSGILKEEILDRQFYSK